MIFNNHSKLKDTHAFLSPSKTAWVNYDDEKLVATYLTAQAAAMGTRFHALAAELIRLKVAMPRDRSTFNAYVNDGIEGSLSPEVVLFYSPNCYGTADTIGFTDSGLVISDLKTGKSPGNLLQLKIYAALFCLEYGVDQTFDVTLKIYQYDEILQETLKPQSRELSDLMTKIIRSDELLSTVQR
jgi:hypothetical protein